MNNIYLVYLYNMKIFFHFCFLRLRLGWFTTRWRFGTSSWLDRRLCSFLVLHLFLPNLRLLLRINEFELHHFEEFTVGLWDIGKTKTMESLAKEMLHGEKIWNRSCQTKLPIVGNIPFQFGPFHPAVIRHFTLSPWELLLPVLDPHPFRCGSL